MPSLTLTPVSPGELGLERDAFNVKSPPYDAVGDGVTDDTVAIQAAIDAASEAGGGTVYFPVGGFKVGALSLPARVHLRGVGSQKDNTTTGTVLIGTAGTDIITLASPGANISVSGMLFYLGRNQIVKDSSFGTAARVRIEDCAFSSAEESAIAIEAGSIEELYVKDILAQGGKYFYRHKNVTVAGSNYLDKSTFDEVNVAGQSENAFRIEALFINTTLWKNLVIGTCQKHGFYADGGVRSLVFVNTNTEGNGQAGKQNETTGSITSGAAALTVASASGYANGDPVVVEGAGTNGIDLFSTVSSIAGSVITLAANAGRTVTDARVTNASYDDFSFNNTIATPANVTFIGGKIGGTGGGGKLRYAIDARVLHDLALIGFDTSAVPVYDPDQLVTVLGGAVGLRQPDVVSTAVFRRNTFATSGGSLEFRRTQIVSPPGKNLVLALRDSADTGAGTHGSIEGRRYDGNRTQIFSIPGKGPATFRDSVQLKTKAGIPADADFDATPGDGTMAVDTTNSKLYVRIGGTWKSVTVA